MFKSLTAFLVLAALIAGSFNPAGATPQRACSNSPKNYVPCIVTPAPQLPAPQGS